MAAPYLLRLSGSLKKNDCVDFVVHPAVVDEGEFPKAALIAREKTARFSYSSRPALTSQ